ncbi:MAG: hypothetical protein APF81_10335 [Desulfosporosinus sp. BRH_c37]|nr:MAG: hypothetical protein APF81_10335 [Desulfosporosinus sp. BRH_c37]
MNFSKIYNTVYMKYWYLVALAFIIILPVFSLSEMTAEWGTNVTNNVIVGWVSGSITFVILAPLPITKINIEIAKEIFIYKGWKTLIVFAVNQLATIAIYLIFEAILIVSKMC